MSYPSTSNDGNSTANDSHINNTDNTLSRSSENYATAVATLSQTALNSDKTHPFWQIIRTVPNFPKTGIDFYDITPLLLKHINDVIDALIAALPKGLLDNIDCLVAVEARGFVFASLLAGRLGKGFILVRKAGKLPPPVISKSYDLEYGNDTLEIQQDLPPQTMLLVDDILATGGTIRTTYDLCQQGGHQVIGVLVLLDLLELHGELPLPVYTVLKG